MTSPGVRQRGATLPMSLIFLVVMTTIGVVGVRFATQQGRLAANSQYQDQAFQSAEGGIRMVVAEIRGEFTPSPAPTTNILEDAIDGGTSPTRTYSEADRAGNTISNSTEALTYVSQAPAAGFSLGTGGGQMVAYQFRIVGTSTVSNTTATATHEQGVQRVGPGG